MLTPVHRHRFAARAVAPPHQPSPQIGQRTCPRRHDGPGLRTAGISH